MSDPTMNSPDGHGSHKRKRDGSEDLGPDPQRLNRSSHGSNGSIPGADNQPNFGHSSLANYEHGLPNAGSELNIDQQILQHVVSTPPDAAFDANNLTQGLSFGDDMNQTPIGGAHSHNSTAAAVYAAREAQSMNQKPSVGSPEWHQIRKNNHKEVERRRREAINEGINQIARIVPNCDKNKGAILQRAIEYICHLQEEKKNTDERFEQHSLTTTHAISEISTSNAKLKAEISRRNHIALKWLQRCRDAGLEFDDFEEARELETFDLE
ncbi:hypothetical protein NUU61_002196 [Penicillium alfredii]|uniref:BHLH domain-containing protein n=1 Tax=Penicillium alfredii TaxID=1506179 RepID=A0A9W9KFR4_9EURO|nr:uncharacterized protein NUU61_002196 [Penicillium alfredii]KAJ5104849.1 hypothetical protein NUU61_002196 [Penicillium alfredii]